MAKIHFNIDGRDRYIITAPCGSLTRNWSHSLGDCTCMECLEIVEIIKTAPPPTETTRTVRRLGNVQLVIGGSEKEVGQITYDGADGPVFVDYSD